MKFKPTLGWIAIAALSLSPILLWWFFGPGPSDFNSYASVTHSIGELSALIAITMFALTFVLSMRIKFIEDIFGGLDKVYIAHGILGGSALIMILMHPIFLVLKFIPSNIRQAALYLMPSNFWSVNFGIIAMLGFILLIAITLYSKMKYNHWKFTHEFMGLIFFFAVLHMLLVRGTASHDYIFHGYYIFAAIIANIGLGAFLYSLLLKDRLTKSATYRVKSVKKLTKDTHEVVMVPEYKPISYKSGQFIFVRFYNRKLGREAHPFSIASESDDIELKILVKELGDYTKKMSMLQPDNLVSVEGPFGRFNYDRKHHKHQVWIAAGIGITPFLGMADDLKKMDYHNNVELFFTARNEEDLIGARDLIEIANEKENFKVIPWLSSRMGHLDTKTILEKIGTHKDTDFFLCGPTSFKTKIISGLIRSGVRSDRIHREVFDFR